MPQFIFRYFFSGIGHHLICEINKVVKFIQICDYSTVNEHFLNDLFQTSLPLNHGHSFSRNQFCRALFALKVSGYLFLKRSLMLFASNLDDRVIFKFKDLMSARSPFDFESLIEYCLYLLQDQPLTFFYKLLSTIAF